MQLIGAKCFVCNDQIKFAPEAENCPECIVGFHLSCLQNENHCPKCNENYLSIKNIHKEKLQGDLDQQLAWGRLALVFISIFVISIQSLVLVVSFNNGIVVANQVLQLAMLLGLVLAAFMGQSWARMAIGLYATIAALTLIKTIWTENVSASNDFVMINLAAAVMFSISAIVLFFSKSLKKFVTSRK